MSTAKYRSQQSSGDIKVPVLCWERVSQDVLKVPLTAKYRWQQSTGNILRMLIIDIVVQSLPRSEREGSIIPQQLVELVLPRLCTGKLIFCPRFLCAKKRQKKCPRNFHVTANYRSQQITGDSKVPHGIIVTTRIRYYFECTGDGNVPATAKYHNLCCWGFPRSAREGIIYYVSPPLALLHRRQARRTPVLNLVGQSTEHFL